jgi:hypothetical protein
VFYYTKQREGEIFPLPEGLDRSFVLETLHNELVISRLFGMGNQSDSKEQEPRKTEPEQKSTWAEAGEVLMFLAFPFPSNEQSKNRLSISYEVDGVTCTFTILGCTMKQTCTVISGGATEKSSSDSILQLKVSRYWQILRPLLRWTGRQEGSGAPLGMLKLIRLFEELAKNGRDISAALESDTLAKAPRDYEEAQKEAFARSRAQTVTGEIKPKTA